MLHPTVGWVSGLDLTAGGEAKVYDGTTGQSYTDKAVVMYIKLPKSRTAMSNIVNIKMGCP